MLEIVMVGYKTDQEHGLLYFSYLSKSRCQLCEVNGALLRVSR